MYRVDCKSLHSPTLPHNFLFVICQHWICLFCCLTISCLKDVLDYILCTQLNSIQSWRAKGRVKWEITIKVYNTSSDLIELSLRGSEIKRDWCDKSCIFCSAAASHQIGADSRTRGSFIYSFAPRWCSCWIGWGKVQKEASQDWASRGLWSGNGYRSEEGLHHWLEPSWTGNGDGFELTLTDPATWFKPRISISLVQITTSDLNSGNWWTHLMRKEYFHLFHDWFIFLDVQVSLHSTYPCQMLVGLAVTHFLSTSLVRHRAPQRLMTFETFDQSDEAKWARGVWRPKCFS